MKRILPLVLLFLLTGLIHAGTVTYGLVDPIKTSRGVEGKGWHVFAINTDIDNAYEICQAYATTQISTATTVEIFSSNALDTSKSVTITGLNSSSLRVQELMSTNSDSGTTRTTSSTTFYRIDQVVVSDACAGTLSVANATDHSGILDVATGINKANACQHYNGEYVSYITGWGASNYDGSAGLTFKLEVLNEAGTVLDDIDSITLQTSATVRGDSNKSVIFPHPIRVAPNSHIAVWVTGTSNQTGSAWMQGYDVATDYDR